MPNEQLAPFQDLAKCTEAAERQALEQLALAGTQEAARSTIEFALGIVNSANQLLAKCAPEIRRQLERNEGCIDTASVERLLRVVLAAFRYLRGQRGNAGFGALALEKTLSNAMIACANAHLGLRIWDGLMLLRDLLLEHAKAHVAADTGVPTSSRGPGEPGAGGLQAARRSVRRPVPRLAKGAASKGGAAPRQQHGSAGSAAERITRGIHRMSIGKDTAETRHVSRMHFPIEHCRGDLAFNVLVVTLLCNVLRVLAQSPTSVEAQDAVPELAQRQHSALEWCLRVREADKDAMEPFLGACFRAYYALGGSRSDSHALDIRQLAIQAYAQTKACSIRELLRYASRAAIRAGSSVIAADDNAVVRSSIGSYYSQIVEHIRPQLESAAASPELVEFCHHLAHVRRRSGDLAGALAACRLGAGAGAAKLAHTILSADVLICCAVDSGVAQSELGPMCDSMGSLAAPALGAEARYTLAEWNALAMCADIARKTAKTTLAALRQDMPSVLSDSVSEALAAVLDVASKIYDTYIRRGAAEKAESTGGTGAAVIQNHSAEASLTLVQICLLRQASNARLQTIAARHSDRLLAMCAEQKCSLDYLRSHSTVFFNHGASMYQLKLHAQAAGAIEAAIRSLSQWIEQAKRQGSPLGNAFEQLCKRFEVAALAYQSNRSFAQASRVYGQAVSWILQHSLDEVKSAVCTHAPHSAIRPPSSTAWAGTAAVVQLLQFVDRYVRMCAARLTKDPGDLPGCKPLQEHMQEPPSDSTVRGWLNEAEAFYWRPYVTPSTQFVAEALRMRLRLALASYEAVAPLGYARCAVGLAKLSRDNGDMESFGDHIHTALEISKSRPDGCVYTLGVIAECYAWQAIAGIESKGSAAKEVCACTRLWTRMCELVSGADDSGGAADPLDAGYLREVVHVTQQVAELLLSRRLYSPGADLLLVALQLASVCERGDSSWAPVAMECLVGLGAACLLRGEPSAAAEYFCDAATRYEAGVLPVHVEIASKIAYANFQLMRGDTAGGGATMELAGELARRSLDGVSAAGAVRSKREAATPETLVLLSRAAHVHSVLALKQGALADSVDFGIHSYRILSSLLKSLELAHRRAAREQGHSTGSVDVEDDPFSDSKPGRVEEGPAAGEADDANSDAEFIASSGNWQLQRLLIDVLAHLADVYSIRGSTKEVEYFLKKALDLSVQIQAPYQERHLRLRETSVLSRKSLWDECTEALFRLRSETVLGDAAEAMGGAMSAADALVVEGDAWRRCGDYKQAHVAYTQAMCLVESMGSSGVAAAMRVAPASLNEATPRLQRILGEVAPIRPRSAGAVDGVGETGRLAAPISVVRDDVEIRQRLVAALGGLADAAEIQANGATGSTGDQAPAYRSVEQRPEHMLLQARLAFADLQRVLAADGAWGLVLKSALVLPAVRQPRALKPRRGTAKAQVRSGLEELDALLRETLEVAITVGSAHVVHECSHLLVLVRAMCAAFGLAPASAGAIAAASGAAVASIIDDCRNVTVMREIVDSIRRRNERVPPRLTTWPADIVGDAMPDTSAMQWSQQSPGGSPAISGRSGLAKARAGMLGGLSLPGAPLDMRSDVDAGPQSRAYFQHAVDGKRIAAAWAMAEAESATTGWAASDDTLPGILPPNWVVCGLSIDQQRDVLVVTRYTHQQQPIVLCLPMRSVAEPQGDGGDGGVLEVDPEPGRSVFDDAFQRLRAIIAQSDETMKTGSACATDGEKRAWWERRSSLDRQLGALLSSIEDEWLGGFRYVLEPTDILSVDGSTDVTGALRTSIENCVVECLPKSYAAKAKSMELSVELCVLVLGVARRTVCRAAAGDGIDAAAENDWLDVCSLLWDVYFYQGAAPQSDEDSLNSLGVRLGDALRDSPIAGGGASNSRAEGARPHLLLVLDKHTQQIPWECLPCIRDYAISRVPSVAVLRDRILAMKTGCAGDTRSSSSSDSGVRLGLPAPSSLLAFSSLGGAGRGSPDLALGPDLLSSLAFEDARPGRGNGGGGDGNDQPPGAYVDGRRVFYVLNPEGDLHRTQANFEAYLQGQASWSGVAGRQPMNNECEHGLSTSDVFMYFGHGGAERYISRSQIRALDRCAVALLLGCSSGQLKLAGEYDALGTATDYLIGGCPALVGNLWDVGDKDIDRFAASLLHLWGLDQHSPAEIAVRLDGGHSPRRPDGPVSLAEAVCWARRACRMAFLTGAAPVVYGIPAYLSR